MSEFKQWEILEALVPYRGDPTKNSKRPVLIVSENEVLVLKMTPINTAISQSLLSMK